MPVALVTVLEGVRVCHDRRDSSVVDQVCDVGLVRSSVALWCEHLDHLPPHTCCYCENGIVSQGQRTSVKEMFRTDTHRAHLGLHVILERLVRHIYPFVHVP